MQRTARALGNGQAREIDIEGIGHVTVGLTPLPHGALSAWDPRSKILIIDQSLPTDERIYALARWAGAIARQ